MTGELTGICKALQEIQNTVPSGARVLLRYDCIPALMLASGIWKTNLNKKLVENVNDLWRAIKKKYDGQWSMVNGRLVWVRDCTLLKMYALPIAS